MSTNLQGATYLELFDENGLCIGGMPAHAQGEGIAVDRPSEGMFKRARTMRIFDATGAVLAQGDCVWEGVAMNTGELVTLALDMAEVDAAFRALLFRRGEVHPCEVETLLSDARADGGERVRLWAMDTGHTAVQIDDGPLHRAD
jgi:hypothetical protein